MNLPTLETTELSRGPLPSHVFHNAAFMNINHQTVYIWTCVLCLKEVACFLGTGKIPSISKSFECRMTYIAFLVRRWSSEEELKFRKCSRATFLFLFLRFITSSRRLTPRNYHAVTAFLPQLQKSDSIFVIWLLRGSRAVASDEKTILQIWTFID